jgi:hypothetical protein
MPATSPKTRRLPQRSCVACGSTTSKRELVRIVRTTEGSVEADPTGKMAGRGAYVCGHAECWTRAVRKGRLERSLKTTLSARDAEALMEYAGQADRGRA